MAKFLLPRRDLARLFAFGAMAAASACASVRGEDTEAPPPRPRMVLALETGLVVGELRPDKAPLHVTRFTTLADQHFYDNLTIVRVAPGHVVQGGDPLFNGEGGSGQLLPAEFSDLPHVRGAIGMARDVEPDTADSQFYICLAERPHLNGRYTLFGQVTEGMDLLDAFAPGDAEMGFISDRAKQPKILAIRVFV